MGNHIVGKAMGIAADLALKSRTNESAIELLDKICIPYSNSDAEFEAEDPNNPGYVHPEYDSYTDPNGPLGILIIEAFGENESYSYETDEDWENWFDGPYMSFKNRYNFW